MTEIEEFILKGNIAAIPFLEGPKALMNVMGKPDSIAMPKKKITIYKYKNFEFSFYDDTPLLLAIYNKVLTNKPDEPILKFNINELIAYLDQNNVAWEINQKYPISEDAFEIVLDNEVRIFIDRNKNIIESCMRNYFYER